MTKQSIALNIILGLAILLIGAPAFSAAPTITRIEKDGKVSFRLDNGRVNLLVNTAEGGSVTSYRDRLGGDVELIDQGRYTDGLCRDHFQSQTWPGEMYHAQYEVLGQTQDDAACTLTLRYAVKGTWGLTVEDKNLNGLTLEKTYRLRADSPALECRVKLTTPPNESKLFAFWQQNIFYAGGQYDKTIDKSFRPSARGVRVKVNHTEPNGHTGTEDWLRDFTAGWQALLDTQRKSGLVVLANYDEMNTSYANGGNATLEPMFRLTFLPGGKSVEYVLYYVPVVGLDNVVSATEDYIAGYAAKSDGKGSGSVALSVIRSINAPRQLTAKVTVANALKPTQMAPAGTLTFDKVGDTPQTQEVKFTGAGDDPLVVKMETATQNAAGATVSGAFEDYFNGAYGWGENITTDMATPVWRGERPKQHIVLNKPSPLLYKPPWNKQLWYAEGLLDDYYGVTPAMNLIGFMWGEGRGKRDRAFVSAGGVWLPTLSSFPYDYDQLLTYNLVILGGVPAEALGPIGQEMLCDYLNAGGALIVLGGPAAYGPSRLHGTPLADLLPVTMADTPFDLAEQKNGVLKPSAEGAIFLQDLDWSAAPRVRYLHKVEVKPWAKVAVEVNGQPFIVYGEVGPKKARVVCILGAPMGAFAKNEMPFWQWKDWVYLLRQAAWWTMKDDRRFTEQ
ncbi:MAG TPA: glutamine amidotransferase [Armatimonadota bacterium]|jgi:uncharacterized membrane protein